MLNDEALQRFALELHGTKTALFKRLCNFFNSCMIEGFDTHVWSWFQQLSTERKMKIQFLGVALAREYAELEELCMYIHDLKWQMSTFLVLNDIFEVVLGRDVFDVIWFYLMKMSKTNKLEFCTQMSGHSMSGRSKKLIKFRTIYVRQKWLTLVRYRLLLPHTLYCLNV